MIAVVVVSNIAVQFPINDWLTWGAFTYPFAFLVTDLSNRAFGPARARQVILVGFLLAVVLSIIASTPRIAVASGTAFLVAQLFDVVIFHRMRQLKWWRAPLASSLIASAVDTLLFFALAFSCSFAFRSRTRPSESPARRSTGDLPDPERYTDHPPSA